MTDKASATSYAVNGSATLLGILTMQELSIIIGAILGIATFLTNLHFKKKAEKRAQELHEKQLESFAN